MRLYGLGDERLLTCFALIEQVFQALTHLVVQLVCVEVGE